MVLDENSDSNLPPTSGFFKTPNGSTIEIRDVWASNVDEEFEVIRGLIGKYPYIAMVDMCM